MNKLILLLVFAGILLLSSIFFSINVVAVDCWSYNSSSTCTSLIGCNWRNDSWSLTGWCEELNCWSLGDQAGCASTVVPGKNCTWQGGGTTYSCERMSCYSLSGTNESSCTNNTQGLSCEWSGSCYNSGASPGTDCWSISNQSTVHGKRMLEL